MSIYHYAILLQCEVADLAAEPILLETPWTMVFLQPHTGKVSCGDTGLSVAKSLLSHLAL